MYIKPCSWKFWSIECLEKAIFHQLNLSLSSLSHSNFPHCHRLNFHEKHLSRFSQFISSHPQYSFYVFYDSLGTDTLIRLTTTCGTQGGMFILLGSIVDNIVFWSWSYLRWMAETQFIYIATPKWARLVFSSRASSVCDSDFNVLQTSLHHRFCLSN